MSEYLRQFLSDYPGIANNPHMYTVDTEYIPGAKIQNYANETIRSISGHFESTIKIRRVEIKEEVTAEITLPMEEVGLFLYGLELYKMGAEHA